MLRLRVAEVLKERGLSMNKISQISQVSYNIVRDICDHPTRTVNTDTINRIAKALGLPVTAIIEDIDEQQEIQ